MNSQFIKEYWTQLLFALTFVLAGMAGYVEWRIASNVKDHLSEISLATPADIESVSQQISRNGEKIEELQKDTDKIDSKVERIVQILLED